MSDEKRVIEGYEETNCVRLAGCEVILAENKTAAEPYMVCDCTWENPFGADEFRNGIVSADYLEIMQEFTRRLTERCQSIEEERAQRGIPLQPLTVADCDPNSKDMDMTGCVVVIKPENLSPEYRSIDHQLALCTHGNGARPKAHGRSVFCTNLYDGKSARWDRHHIAGIIPAEQLPDWAREKLAALQKSAEKESVIDKIRQSEQNAAHEKPSQKKHDKGGPEH